MRNGKEIEMGGRWGEGRSNRKEIGAAECRGAHSAQQRTHVTQPIFPLPVVFVIGFLVKVDTQAFHE